MSKHTPTPWRAVGSKIVGGADRRDGNPMALFDCVPPIAGLPDRRPEGVEERMENADRAVACVNALAGVEGEALDLLPRVLVDMRRALPAGYDTGPGPSEHDLAEIGLAALPLLRALGGAIDG